MFKCCVCNKSSKKEKSGGEVTKQSQKATDTQIVPVDSTTLIDENRHLGKGEKLNGDVQRSEKVSPSMENCAGEVVDDLTVKSPLPSGKRDEANDSLRSRNESMVESNEKNCHDENDQTKEDKIGRTSGGKDEIGNGDADAIDNVSLSGNGGVMTAILNAGITNTVKTNIYDSSAAYIERTIDDGPEEEGDDSVFESCPNDNNANKKPPPASSVPRWLSEEDDGEHDSEECSGMQEPPATPVARDELALRRHRFFSDLLQAAQNATEHRVRFDPLGPMVHSGQGSP